MAGPLFEVVAPVAPDDPSAITLHAQLQAGAGRAELTGVGAAALRLRVAAPPASDAANRAAVQVVAELFGVAVEQVSVIGGGGADKVLRVEGLDEAAASRLIEVARNRVGPAGGDRGRHLRGR